MGRGYLGLVLAALLILGGCAQADRTVSGPETTVQGPLAEAPPPPPSLEPSGPPPDTRVRVGLLVPLSGRTARLGQAMLDAAHMAVFDVANDDFILLPVDTKGTPDGAAAAARMVLNDGARLILGPLFSAGAASVRPIASEKGVAVLSFSNDWSIAGGNLWVLGFQPQEQVQRVLGFASSRGLRSVGVLAPNTPFGQAVVDAATKAAPSTGVTLRQVERYPPGSGSTEAIRRLAAPGAGAYQAILVGENGTGVKEIAPLLPYFDLPPGPIKLLGTGLWEEESLGADALLNGSWFAAPSPTARADFEGRFQSLYGYPPPRLATLAYDATALAAALAKSGDLTPFETADLTNSNGFLGVDGLFRLLPTGTTERALAVLEVTPAGSIVLDPAPGSFDLRAF